jgi:hypothetical protein
VQGDYLSPQLPNTDGNAKSFKKVFNSRADGGRPWMSLTIVKMPIDKIINASKNINKFGLYVEG